MLRGLGLVKETRGHREEVKLLSHSPLTQAHKMATLPGGGLVRGVSLKPNYNSQNSVRGRRASELLSDVVGCGPHAPPHSYRRSFSRRCSFGTEPRLSPQCPTGLGVFRLCSETSLGPKKTILPYVASTPAHNALRFPEGPAALVIAC